MSTTHPEPGDLQPGDSKPGGRGPRRTHKPSARRPMLGPDQPRDGREPMGCRDLRPVLDAIPTHPQNDRDPRVIEALDGAIEIEQDESVARVMPAVCVARAKALLEADGVGLLTPVCGGLTHSGEWSPAFDLVQAEIAAGIRDIWGEPYPHFFTDTELEHEPHCRSIWDVRCDNGELGEEV